MSKKSAKPQKEAATYEIRDIVLGKVRGYAPWPAMVVDPETVPPSVKGERPSNKKTTFYCVRFFPTGDHAWLVEKDISKLQPHEIDAYISEPHKKSADLLEGYRIALDPTKWLAERDALASEEAEAEENAEVDQLNSDGEAVAASTTSKSRKRKRESESASAKVKREPKGKKETSASAKKKSVAGSAKSRKNGAKSRTMVESEDEGERDADGAEDDAGPSRASPPPAKRARREKADKEEDPEDNSKSNDDPEAVMVRDWRHKLQKSFLSNKVDPQEEDMPALDALFKTVEDFEAMTIDHLQFSKIGKVMRHIAVLPDEKVPRDAEFRFKERASALVTKWHQILNASKANGSESGGAAAPAGATNGNSGAPAGASTAAVEGEADAQGVAEATAAINLNGNGNVADDDADALGDLTVLAEDAMDQDEA